jgi:hypothetical protein
VEGVAAVTREGDGMSVLARLMGHGGVYDQLGQVATMLGTGHADQKHCGERIDAVRDAVEVIDQQHRGAVSDLQRIAVACDNGSDTANTIEFIRRVAAPYLHHTGAR